MKGATKRPGRAVGVHRDVEAGAGLEVVERVADLLDRLVGAVERGAEDGHDADRVLVAPGYGFVCGEVEAISFHRDEPHLDVPVVGELLPADLHVDAHDQVGRSVGSPAAARRFCQRRFSARPPSMAASLEPVVEQPTPPAGPCHRSAQHVDAAHLQLRRLRILVLVDHVLVEALRHERLGLRLHPGGHEGGHVEARVAVEHQLVVDDLVRDVGRKLVGRQLMPWDAVAFEREERAILRDRHMGGSLVGAFDPRSG